MIHIEDLQYFIEAQYRDGVTYVDVAELLQYCSENRK